MPIDIVDLDIVVPENLPVRIRGEIYELPGDIPIPDFVEIERLVKSLDEGEGNLQALYDKILDLFRIEQPDLEKLPIGARQLGALIPQLYMSAADQDDGDANRPPQGAGTRSGKKTRPKRSASSRS